jgi:CO/xanthine dehydrogenase Mo-binding subunit
MNGSVGQPVNRVDGRLKVTGGARYSADIASPCLDSSTQSWSTAQ